MSALNNGENYITSSGRVSNFKLTETICSCGCGFNDVHQELIDCLQTINDCLAFPIKLNCVCRCDKYNKSIGGAKDSYHVKGMAADIAAIDEDTGDDMASEKLFEMLNPFEIPCIIRYPGHHFCHVDVRETKTRLSKNKQGGYDNI